MSDFEIFALFGLGFIALGLFYVGLMIADLRKEVAEIWKRMQRLD